MFLKVGASTCGEKEVRPVWASFDEPESCKFTCGSTSMIFFQESAQHNVSQRHRKKS